MTLINFFFLEKKVGISWSVNIVFDTLRVFHCKIDNKLQMPLSLKYDIFYWLINKFYKMRLKGKMTLKCCILEKKILSLSDIKAQHSDGIILIIITCLESRRILGTLSRISRVFSKMTMLFLTMTFCPPSGVVLAVAHDAASPSKLIFNRKLPLQYLLLLIHNIISLHGWAHHLPEVHWLPLSLRVFLENVNFRWWGFSFQMCILCRPTCIRTKKMLIQ